MTLKTPAEKKYRVIQWGVGNVGTLALRHFAHNPAYELVGVLCNRPEPANALPAACEAPPGFMSHNELGLMPLRGVIRP